MNQLTFRQFLGINASPGSQIIEYLKKVLQKIADCSWNDWQQFDNMKQTTRKSYDVFFSLIKKQK